MSATDMQAAVLPGAGGQSVPRDAVVQGVLDLFESPSYLEVGVNQGRTFNSLRAAMKVAVDPQFLFDHQSLATPDVRFHEVTSDAYFGSADAQGDRFDVIYLDGLHTAEQTTRDLINAISFLKPGGVIVIDDVLPSSYPASLPDRSHTRTIRAATKDPAGAWMGDVYRVVFFVETFCQQFNYATVTNNHGQLIMWREPRQEVAKRTIAEVGLKEYKDVFLERGAFKPATLPAILQKIVASR